MTLDRRLQIPPLSLYVHIPWCARKCPYCDFNSHRAQGRLPEARYVDALLADLDQELTRAGDRTIETIFLGGGTPSLFRPEAIDRLLRGIRERAPVATDAEITLEANPGTVDGGQFNGFYAAGVNRLSLGIQSFQDRLLTRLGRIHSADEAIRAVEKAREAGFANLNLDLMFGLPEQRLAEAVRDIETAIGLHPEHISYYQLTLEPNTLFHRFPPALPPDEAIWDIQQAGQARLRDAGYVQYEVSAYAREGRDCRHNLNYWRFGDYLGIGAGAHGKLTNREPGSILRRWKLKHPEAYLDAASRAAAVGGEHCVDPADVPVEFLMNLLRLRAGFPEASFTERTGLPRDALEPAFTECLQEGLLVRIGRTIRCSDIGWNFLDSVLARFLHRH